MTTTLSSVASLTMLQGSHTRLVLLGCKLELGLYILSSRSEGANLLPGATSSRCFGKLYCGITRKGICRCGSVNKIAYSNAAVKVRTIELVGVLDLALPLSLILQKGARKASEKSRKVGAGGKFLLPPVVCVSVQICDSLATGLDIECAAKTKHRLMSVLAWKMQISYTVASTHNFSNGCILADHSSSSVL